MCLSRILSSSNFSLNLSKKVFLSSLPLEKIKAIEKYDSKTKEFIENHLNIALRKVNGIDPFTYIQNISKKGIKNPHGIFTNMFHF